jgi:hypothetical protein
MELQPIEVAGHFKLQPKKYTKIQVAS